MIFTETDSPTRFHDSYMFNLSQNDPYLSLAIVSACIKFYKDTEDFFEIINPAIDYLIDGTKNQNEVLLYENVRVEYHGIKFIIEQIHGVMVSLGANPTGRCRGRLKFSLGSGFRIFMDHRY
jgi:hypothetical protein